MDLSKIISVSGKPGLFRVIAQGRQAVIAESLIDGKRIPVHGSMQVSSLDEISMFTTDEDMPLPEVMDKVHTNEGGKATFNAKKAENKELFSKMKEVLPDFDQERVHASDIRKLFSWYALLLSSGEIKRLEEEKAKAEKEEKKAKKSAASEKKDEKKAPGDKKEGDKKAKKTTAKKTTAKKKAASKKKTSKGPAKPKSTSAKGKGASVRKGSQRGG